MSVIELQQRILAAHEEVVVAESQINANVGDVNLSPGQEEQLEALVCEWEQLGRALTTWCRSALDRDQTPSEPAQQNEGPMGEVAEATCDGESEYAEE